MCSFLDITHFTFPQIMYTLCALLCFAVFWYQFDPYPSGLLHKHWDKHKIVSISLNQLHYDGVIMGAMASQITSLTIVYSTVYSGADQRKDQSSAPLASVQGIHRGPPHKWPVVRKMFPFDDVIMQHANRMNPLRSNNTTKTKQNTTNLYVYLIGYTI